MRFAVSVTGRGVNPHAIGVILWIVVGFLCVARIWSSWAVSEAQRGNAAPPFAVLLAPITTSEEHAVYAA
jgi:hypothetical protein